MPSFDVVSKVNMQEVTNAVDQTRREILTRYDLKGTKAAVELKPDLIELTADDEMKLRAVQEILKQKLSKRGISLKSVTFEEPQTAAGDTRRQEVKVRQALTTDELRDLNKIIKQGKFKVTAQIQADQLRVSGKKKDDLQAVIALLREQVQDIDLQFVNFRD